MKKNQNGSTLIVVLILLLIITVVGTFGIRQSLTSLNIATNSQAQQLLMQSSDTVLYRLGQPGFAAASDKLSSMLGYAIMNEGSEVVFCFRSQLRPNSAFYVGNTSLIKLSDDESSFDKDGTPGFCDPTSISDYSSKRKAQITQVAVIVNPKITETVAPLQYATTGVDLVSIGKAESAQSKRIRVYVTSLLPNLTNSSDEDIKKCLQLPNEIVNTSSDLETVSMCLKNKGVPFNTQVQDFQLATSQCAVTTDLVNC